MRNNSNDFKLIETIKFNKNIKHLDLHINRLKESAEFFKFNFDEKMILNELDKISLPENNKTYKVRLLLDKTGKVKISCAETQNIFFDYNISISNEQTNSNDIFLLHKTTNRNFYNEHLHSAREKNFYDIIFMNEKNEITEGSITNIYIKKNDSLYTPPLDCGLLNGTIRKSLIYDNNTEEKIIYITDLRDSDSVYISNAIIGLQKVNNIDFNNLL